MLKAFLNIFSTWKATAILLLFLVVTLALATWIESVLGSPAARTVIYHAWWMYGLYLLLILNFILLSIRLHLRKRAKWGILMLHYGFVITLIGAFISNSWGYDGTLHIRTGERTDELTLHSGVIKKLPFSIELNQFSVTRYPGSHTPSSYESRVSIREGDDLTTQSIYMNNMARVGSYRLFQSSYDDDEQGTTLAINHDPIGTTVTYIGYFVLMIGIGASFASRNSRLRQLYKQIQREGNALSDRTSVPSKPYTPIHR